MSGSLAMNRILRLAASRTKRSAMPSMVTLVTRSSTARASRESRETRMIPAMKQAPILTPSGRSMTYTTVV